MCLPQGEALLVVGQLLVAQSAAERSGAAFDGRLSAAMAGADLTSILPPAATGAGRWAKVRRGKHGGGDGGTGAQGSSGAKGACLASTLCWPAERGRLLSCKRRCYRAALLPTLTPLAHSLIALPSPLQPRRSAAGSSQWPL